MLDGLSSCSSEVGTEQKFYCELWWAGLTYMHACFGHLLYTSSWEALGKHIEAAGKQMEQCQVCGDGSTNKPPHSQGQQLLKYIQEHIYHILCQNTGEQEIMEDEIFPEFIWSLIMTDGKGTKSSAMKLNKRT